MNITSTSISPLKRIAGTIPAAAWTNLAGIPFVLVPGVFGFTHILVSLVMRVGTFTVFPALPYLIRNTPIVANTQDSLCLWQPRAGISATIIQLSPYGGAFEPSVGSNLPATMNSDNSRDIVLQQVANDIGQPQFDVPYVAYYIEENI